MVATQRFFMFTPKIGEIIQFDDRIFQMGWFNHQLALLGPYFLGGMALGGVPLDSHDTVKLHRFKEDIPGSTIMTESYMRKSTLRIDR